jgi:hypothetical protein
MNNSTESGQYPVSGAQSARGRELRETVRQRRKEAMKKLIDHVVNELPPESPPE